MSSTPEADRLRATVEQWRGIQDRLQPSVNVSGGTIETTSIGDSMDHLADMIQQSEIGKVDPIAKSVQWPNVSQQIGQLQNYVQQIVNNGAAHHVFQNQAQNIVNTIWSLRSAIVWLLPPSISGDGSLQNPNLAELIASAKKVIDLRREAGSAERELQDTLEVVSSQAERAKSLLAEIEGSERTASNARSNAETNSATSKQMAEELGKLLNEEGVRSEALKKLLAEFTAKKVLVDETLEGASKVALANSFQQRRKSLSNERWGWVAGFVVGIVLLGLLGGFLVPKLLADANPSGQPKYSEIISHI